MTVQQLRSKARNAGLKNVLQNEDELVEKKTEHTFNHIPKPATKIKS